MKIFFIFFLLISLNNCEKLFYGEYEIFEKNKIKKDSRKNIHIVKRGENLYLISKKFSISIDEIIKENNIKSPFKIFPNQKLIIPKKTIYTVLRGDTLYSISRRFNVDKYNLSKLNKLKTNNIIYVGQRLIIPNYSTIKKSEVNLTIEKISKKKKAKFKQNKDKTIFIWPVRGEVILKYGMIKPGLHNDGINISANNGEDVVASRQGKVIYAGNEIPGYGNLILIKHDNKWITAYAHLERIFLKRGAQVKKGEKIGIVGSSGNVNSSQLHFEIRKGKKALNPREYLSWPYSVFDFKFATNWTAVLPE